MTGEERLLVLRSQNGDAEAFGALISARRGPLLLLVAATLGDWDEAEDALQDALWRGFTGLGGLQAVEAFDAWLRRIVLNVARDHLRSAIGRMRREGGPAGDAHDLEDLLVANERQDGPHDALLADREACAGILAAIAALPPAQRRAGRLAWVAGVPIPEIARLLDVSQDSVHSALHRARGRLGSMFYAKGDWRRDVQIVPDGSLRLAGYPGIQRLVAGVRSVRSDLPVTAVDLHAPADMRMRLFWAEVPALEAAPPPKEALPLDGLADAAGLDLEPFGARLARFTVDGRPYALPHQDTPHLFLYNADLLAQAGLPLPAWDWTWDDFFGYCRRLAAAGLPALSMYSPTAWDAALVAEELGATRDRPEPFAQAVEFVRDWERQGWAAPHEVPDWAFGQWLNRRCVFFTLQYGHGNDIFHWGDRCYRPFRWGVAPVPRFQRGDPPVRYWFHDALQIQGTAPNPTLAFEVARVILTEGPVPLVDNLPAYRTARVMKAWLAQELPLGKECLLELDAATDPLYAPAHFFAVPGAGEAIRGMLAGSVPPDQGIERIRAGVAAYRAGERVVFND